MSIKIMSLIWENGPDRQADRFVLLALADFASDSGECWPAVKTIAKKVCMSERGVQKIVQRLEAEGWLSVVYGGGRHGCNSYTINPERSSPPNVVHPPNVDTETPNVGAENPERGSPEPSRTIKNRQGAREKVEAILSQSLSPSVAADFYDHRKAMRKPLTEKAATLIVGKLAKCRNPDEIANLSIMNGWQGVFPERQADHKAPQDDAMTRWRKMAGADQ